MLVKGEIVTGEYKAGNKGRAIVLLRRLNTCIQNFVRILEVIPVERIEIILRRTQPVHRNG